jgi:hypothetical protein
MYHTLPAGGGLTPASYQHIQDGHSGRPLGLQRALTGDFLGTVRQETVVSSGRRTRPAGS